ncbi:hypothetical protein [Alicyclobacillus acidocaldarius]|uniref:Uncharacterized protein n=1 Tax=Alicyclobacillus acidocaldarius subsp. acidocaldarius (strain ATCC 27009 / DSM 446 / BCRC 14685 / JCM 5260 / KCTC 1825 / NBRC 15652 / NCIMB 11725 / NRRL B-14509 / 104-IA) TaxID=521098 RepID=C8WY07_ALIAD|nr:hypothetical protein [Alicyclobacillus acidocaldarius]ACV58969.1 hypothetical protein Aaci_1957 [Alicyclobacillus acidocaldarius subsp. acidocaldarius DSM 446]
MLFAVVMCVLWMEGFAVFQSARRLGRGPLAGWSFSPAHLMRLTFAVQLAVELACRSKALGGTSAAAVGCLAGVIALRPRSLLEMSELMMEVFMGISMGIFLIGNIPAHIAWLLLLPIAVSSGMAFVGGLRATAVS